MATPTTTTAADITSICTALNTYERDLEFLQNHIEGGGIRDLTLKLSIDLGKLGAAINALAGAPTGGEKTAALGVQTNFNRLARVMAGTDP